MEALIMLPAFLLMLLNFLGGLVGGIGIAVQGEWRLLLGGIGWGLIGHFVLSFALMPGMIFAPLAAKAADNGKVAQTVLFAMPSLIWTYIIVSASSIYIFTRIASLPDAGFFHLLWAYSVTTAPWSFMAQKDRQAGNSTASMLMFFVQLGVVSMMVSSWIEPANYEYERLAYWFLPFMALGLLAQASMVWSATKDPYGAPY